ncbi:DUF550 domain-containing protein [Citrobacter sp. CK187]|nr:DUF550 domain-containing protein [Citrobacter sp. CK187]MDM3014448.1 DUF550 domain-containing protein [Citrobacter sp. CK187]
MTTITREQLIKRAQARLELMQEVAREFSESPNAQMDFRLAEIALASLDAGSNSHPAHGPLSNDRLHRIREILGKAAAQSDGGNIGYAMSDAVKAIDELLDVRKADPVCYYRKGSDGFYFASPTEQRPGTIPLYAAAPAPVVPEEKRDDDGNTTSEFDHGWNSCRAAMLQGSQPVSNRDELREQVRREHAEWSDATFGNVGPVGPLKHLSKEALEAAANPEDPLEWADMQFLLWDAQRRMGISDEFVTRAIIEKLEINKSRQWPEPKDGEPRLHIKSDQRQEHM